MIKRTRSEISHLSSSPMFRLEVCAAIKGDLVTQSVPSPAGELLPLQQLIVVGRGGAAPPTVQGKEGRKQGAHIAFGYNFML